MFYLMFNHSRAGLRLNNFELSRAIKQIQCVVGYVVAKLYVVDQQNTKPNFFLSSIFFEIFFLLTNTTKTHKYQLITILSIKIIIIISKLTSVSN